MFVDAQKNCLMEPVHLGPDNICFVEEIGR